MIISCDEHRYVYEAFLLEELSELACNSARNLGYEHILAALSSEHWQMVLSSVTARMQMRDALPPLGWKSALAQHVGRQAN